MVDGGVVARRARYPSDTSDEQWALIEPLLPQVKTGGRPEKHPRRAVVDAILYVVRTGCAWRQLPADFPPWQTVYWYFVRWEQARAEQILPVVREQLRLQEGRNAEPSAGLIDSQSVKGKISPSARRAEGHRDRPCSPQSGESWHPATSVAHPTPTGTAARHPGLGLSLLVMATAQLMPPMRCV
jgi:transposase